MAQQATDDLSVKEAAALLGVSVATVRRAIIEKRLLATVKASVSTIAKRTPAYRIKRAHVEAFLRSPMSNAS